MEPNYLVLVGKHNPISEDFIKTINLVPIKHDTDGKDTFLEEETYKAYLSLRDYLLREENVEIGIDSAYRDVEYQRQVMDEFIRQYGEEYAKATVAIPGTSEHHTGLAIDIVPKINGQWVIENEDMVRETEVFATIHKYLPQFGFIVRYPKWREVITGYTYEPWHIRYVGDSEIAKHLTDNKIALEDYLKK